MLEFWYDDSGDHFEDGSRNRVMESLLGGGFYGPGLLLERKVESSTNRIEEYKDILSDWDDETEDLLSYLKKAIKRS